MNETDMMLGRIGDLIHKARIITEEIKESNLLEIKRLEEKIKKEQEINLDKLIEKNYTIIKNEQGKV